MNQNKVARSIQCNSPQNKTKEKLQNNNFLMRQNHVKQKTSLEIDDDNNQSIQSQNTNDNQKQVKVEGEIKKKKYRGQDLKILSDERVLNSVFNKEANIQAINLQIKRESANKIKAAIDEKRQKSSKNVHRIRNLEKLVICKQELKPIEEKQIDDLNNNKNEQIGKQYQPPLGLQLPQKERELQELKDQIIKLKDQIIQLKVEKKKIINFLEIASSRISSNPKLQKVYLYRSSSFQISENQQKEKDFSNDERPQGIQQNIISKINRIKLKDEEVHNLNAQNKTLLENNHILSNQIEEKEKQINILDQYVKDNADTIQKLQNDIVAINHENPNLEQLIQKQVSELAEQKRQIDQQNQALQTQQENINQELQNKNIEIEQLRCQINQDIELKNNKLQIQNQEIDQFILNLDIQKQQNEQLNLDLISQNQELDKQKQQNEQLNLDLISLNQELDKQKQQNEQLNLDLINLNQELDNQKQQNQQLNLDLINLNQELDNQKQQNQQLNLDLINLNQVLENQQQQNQQLNLDLINLNSELENQQQQNQQLNSELENQQQQNQQLNLDLINLNSELDNQKQILQKLQSQNKDYNNNILDILNQLDIRDQNNQTTNLSNEINDKITQLQIDSDTLKYGNSIISLMVKSVNSNRSEIFKVRLKDSINDLYLMTVSKGIHNQLPLNISLLLPSKKNKRIVTSDWNKKFYDIFGPNENNETIQIEFSN